MPLRAIPEEGILKQDQRKEERPSRVHNQFSKTIGVTGLACTSGYPSRQNTILLIRKKESMHKWYATISRPSYLERKALGTGLWNRAQGKQTHLLSQEHTDGRRLIAINKLTPQAKEGEPRKQARLHTACLYQTRKESPKSKIGRGPVLTKGSNARLGSSAYLRGCSEESGSLCYKLICR